MGYCHLWICGLVSASCVLHSFSALMPLFLILVARNWIFEPTMDLGISSGNHTLFFFFFCLFFLIFFIFVFLFFYSIFSIFSIYLPKYSARPPTRLHSTERCSSFDLSTHQSYLTFGASMLRIYHGKAWLPDKPLGFAQCWYPSSFQHI